MRVTRISDALEAGDLAGALDGAVLAWRAARTAVLADLIDAIAARSEPVRIAATGKPAFQAAWLALAKQPSAHAAGTLAATLGKNLFQAEVRWGTPDRDLKRGQPLLDRLAALAALDDDPRFAPALVDVIRRVKTESIRVLEPALALLERISDERVVPRLRELVARPPWKTAYERKELGARLAPIADTIEAVRRPPAPAGAAELLAELRGPVPSQVPQRAELDTLFAEVYARPDDDGPREVLADALLEREDPRGELIALQLRAARAPLPERERKRMASLQRAGEQEWLGELALVTKLRVFRRGFLDEAELVAHSQADDAMWARAAADRRLATVRVLHKGDANEDLYRGFVLSPHARGLREIDVPSTKFLAALRGRAHPLHAVKLHAGLGKEPMQLVLELQAKLGLRRLGFVVREPVETLVDRLARWEGRARFEELRVTPAPAQHQAWGKTALAWLDAHARLAPVARLGLEIGTATVVAQRGARGLVLDATCTHEWLLVQLAASELADRLERLTVRGTPRYVAPVELPKLVARLQRRATVELLEGWAPEPAPAPAATGRGRARRAPRP